ncbi:MAG: hypothetical protein V2G33_00290 [bacterium JZ-2024 1]
MVLLLLVQLFFTGEWLGRFEECLCDGKKTRGVLGQALVLQNLKRETPFPFLFHTGDLLSSPEPNLLDVAFSILKKEGYRFLAIGEQELGFLPGEILKNAAKYEIPLILTNTHHEGILRWYEEIVEGKKIVFLNLVSRAGAPLRWELQWEEEAIEEVLFQISGADWIFLISHLPEGHTEGIVERFSHRFHGIIQIGKKSGKKLEPPPFWIYPGNCMEVHQVELDTKTGEVTLSLMPIPYVEAKPPGEILAEMARTRPAGESRKGYNTGSALCVRCHQEIFTQWKSTRHSREYDAKEKNCSRCHNPLKEIGEKYVGCEACHGPASRHIFQQYLHRLNKLEKVEKMPSVSPETCFTCHKPDGKHIKAFSLDEAWKKIMHRTKAETDGKKQTEPVPPEEEHSKAESP